MMKDNLPVTKEDNAFHKAEEGHFTGQFVRLEGLKNIRNSKGFYSCYFALNC